MKKAPKYIQPAYKGTRAVLDHAISNTLSNRKPRTAFQRAVLKAVESIPRREARVPAFRKGWAAFCQLAGRTVGDHQTALPRCCSWREHKGRWTITNDDLCFVRDVAMWIGRADPEKQTMAEIFWGHALVSRLHKKRMWQAWLRFQRTGLTHEHIQLIAKASWYQNCWRGHGESIYMDGKHPWGDSFRELSIYEICGWELPRNKAGEVEMKPHHEERAWNLFDELPFAIPAAALNAQQMQIGPFTLGYAQEGQIWLQHDKGEGMQTAPEKLGKHLAAFWKKEF